MSTEEERPMRTGEEQVMGGDGAAAIAGGLRRYVAIVSGRVRERHERRAQRRERAARIPEHALPDLVRALRGRMAAYLATPEHERTDGAFRPLSDDELGVLDRQVRVYERDERFVVLEENPEHPDADIAEWLHILRLNRALDQSLVPCNEFRTVARACIDRQRVVLAECLARWERRQGFSAVIAEEPVLVLPWRAGLLYAEEFRAHDASLFWHVGVRRNERTLQPELYYEGPAPAAALRNRTHLVCDPMLATGGTQAAIIERLAREGVPPERIVAVAVVAAPEGVELLLGQYPALRIVTCALDECLDEHGYITGPGLGDFGDLAYADLDGAYVAHAWLLPGILTNEQATRILRRMREHPDQTPAVAPAG